MWVKLDDVKYGGNLEGARFYGLFLSVFLIWILGVVYSKLSSLLTEWENHRTQTEFDNSQITKTFLFEAVNNFFILFFIAFLKSGELRIPILDPRNATCTSTTVSCSDTVLLEHMHESLKAQCEFNATAGEERIFEIQVVSCMNELWTQMLVVMVAKQSVGLVAEILIPEVKSFSTENVRDAKVQKMANKAGIVVSVHSSALGEQVLMPIYNSTARLKDFSTKAIQFGYITLFAVAFPWAPAFALANNIVELRSDAYKLVNSFRRPEFKTKQGIGTWLFVFEAIAVLAVVTNAALLGFVGGQAADMWITVFTRLDFLAGGGAAGAAAGDHQASTGTAGGASGGGAEWLAEQEQAETARYERLAVPGNQGERLRDENLWLVAGLTEHFLLALRFTIAAMVPTTPAWVNIGAMCCDVLRSIDASH